MVIGWTGERVKQNRGIQAEKDDSAHACCIPNPAGREAEHLGRDFDARRCDPRLSEHECACWGSLRATGQYDTSTPG
jgi:hypothetical protein